ncbi:SsgA family sporulation/cell division regulator [Nocardioides mesophilus]|uniref:SsgA family sporulation/cell division regulator n=1 Tax=Nocardioides mesophilus TaxID=433659 RepID=A0A7G9R7M1_9ACTN|nr:SsgA family sporulation/cell division regulator [Nocardioides mesophilus]QNN51596.1 SsgA family sporulation/cell division regulator [Nocardioides mesophilus]
MNTAPHVVVQPLALELLGSQPPAVAEAELRYDRDDPYAVTLVFLEAGNDVVWLFGRDLLLQGVSEPAGEGDVHVFPSVDAEGRAVIMLSLSSPDGQALMKAPAADVLDFLARATHEVWPGTEHHLVSTDAVIAALLVDD